MPPPPPMDCASTPKAPVPLVVILSPTVTSTVLPSGLLPGATVPHHHSTAENAAQGGLGDRATLHQSAAAGDRLRQNAVAVVPVGGDGAALLGGDIHAAALPHRLARAAERQIEAVDALRPAGRAAGTFEVGRHGLDDAAAAGNGLRQNADGIVRLGLNRSGAGHADLAADAILVAIAADGQRQTVKGTVIGRGITVILAGGGHRGGRGPADAARRRRWTAPRCRWTAPLR